MCTYGNVDIAKWPICMQNTHALFENTICLKVRTVAGCLLVTCSALTTRPSAFNEIIFYENMFTLALLKLGHKHTG